MSAATCPACRAPVAPIISYSMAGAVVATGMSRSSLDRAIRAGKLRAKYSSEDDDGNPTGVLVIPAGALREYVEDLADA